MHKGRSPTAFFRSPSRLLAAKRKLYVEAKLFFALPRSGYAIYFSTLYFNKKPTTKRRAMDGATFTL
ncbi:hypothetical protein AGMMS50293_25240 [Spirochaetia bacterium]|nr:hypothetical protein AGMMS50293_25240 [Spirochaetia bacterium]